ncbi:Endonuclease 3 [Arabidopsis thaliana]|uniref:Aspergillus nuclease S1 n=2 Tax=Arabidopsis TaxID=3701 RepID=A0A178V091_ARATH|nr:S1/P1 nuclease [Arabidopsis thaliana x Arabidopsis arenosa]OAO99578.1 ENDO3 [Arabidopsis thaliana]
MGWSLRMWIVSILVLTQLVNGALCWGDAGHYAVCKIAQSYFEEDTVVSVKKLLPESANGELAAVCSWPDEIKKLPQWRWTSALHFADTPDYKCNYEYSRDCPKDWCVTGAIFNYTNQLMSTSENSQSIVHYNLTEALMFLSHYMGDIHQPLHEGFIGDLGGNKIKVHWYNQETNLHRVWDDMIIESALETYYNSSLPRMIHELQAKLKNGWSNDVPSWESCQLNQTACPNPYASESIDLACKYAYRNATAGTTLGDYYFVSRLPVVEKRLAQGGIRLAGTLNRIFSAKRKLARA